MSTSVYCNKIIWLGVCVWRERERDRIMLITISVKVRQSKAIYLKPLQINQNRILKNVQAKKREDGKERETNKHRKKMADLKYISNDIKYKWPKYN